MQFVLKIPHPFKDNLRVGLDPGVNHINITINNNIRNTQFVSLFHYSAYCGWHSTALVPVCPCCWSNVTACVQPLDHVAGHWLNSSSPCRDGFGLSGGDVTKLANTAPRTRQSSETEHDEDKVTFYFSATPPLPLPSCWTARCCLASS